MALVQDWVSATNGATPTATTTVNLGVAATAGNTLLVAVTGDATVATPSGYTSLASSVHNAGMYLFGKVAAGSETGVTVTPSVTASTCVAIAEYSGIVGTLITDRIDQTASNGSTTGQNARSTGTTATTTQATELAVAVFGYSANQAVIAGGGGNAWASMTNGFAEILDVGTTKLSATNVGLMVATLDLTSTGTVETTATMAAAVVSRAESLVATFKVSAGGGPAATPVPVVVGTKTPSGRATALISRNSLQDPPVLITPSPVVVAVQPKARPGRTITSRSSLADVAVASAATTPPPLVVTAQPRRSTALTIIDRSTLQDDPVLATPAPLVIGARQRPVPSAIIVLRSPSLQDLATPQPLVITARTPRTVSTAIVVRSSIEDFATPRPTVVTARTTWRRPTVTVVRSLTFEPPPPVDDSPDVDYVIGPPRTAWHVGPPRTAWTVEQPHTAWTTGTPR